MVTMEKVSKFVKDVGLPGAIALYVLYQAYGGQQMEAREASRAALALAQKTHDTLVQHAQASATLGAMQQQIVNLSLQECVNAARNEGARQACFDALYRQPRRGER